jgi:hypothetical protein
MSEENKYENKVDSKTIKIGMRKKLEGKLKS